VGHPAFVKEPEPACKNQDKDAPQLAILFLILQQSLDRLRPSLRFGTP
jgi:hypothetical protein